MGKIFIILTLIVFLFTTPSYAFDEEYIYLDSSEVQKLEAPDVNTDRMSAINQNGEFVIKENELGIFNADDEIFDTKAGQIFSKFIDDKVINNKFLNFSGVK